MELKHKNQAVKNTLSKLKQKVLNAFSHIFFSDYSCSIDLLNNEKENGIWLEVLQKRREDDWQKDIKRNTEEKRSKNFTNNDLH